MKKSTSRTQQSSKRTTTHKRTGRSEGVDQITMPSTAKEEYASEYGPSKRTTSQKRSRTTKSNSRSKR